MRRIRLRGRAKPGLSLIDLVVLVLIIAILVALVLPIWLRIREDAGGSQLHSSLRNADATTTQGVILE